MYLKNVGIPANRVDFGTSVVPHPLAHEYFKFIKGVKY